MYDQFELNSHKPSLTLPIRKTIAVVHYVLESVVWDHTVALISDLCSTSIREQRWLRKNIKSMLNLPRARL